tara:strand:- start:2215 stop:3441 length:1227 start_codon:yes stop_codon:yes gene_type:complete
MSKSTKRIECFPVSGVNHATCCSETKYRNRDDLLLFVVDPGSHIFGCFTASTMPSAPVIWSKKNIKKNQKIAQRIVLLINAGNANAFTGNQGQEACEKKALALSKLYKCERKNVFFASTGVIGEQLPYHQIIEKFGLLNQKLSQSDFIEPSNAILTTDLKPKTYTSKFKINDEVSTISAIAKGSGMIFPNMGTMLAFIFTDFSIDKKSLSTLTKKAVAKSFNRISVDGDTSTSDTVFVITTNKKNLDLKTGKRIEALKSFYKELRKAMVNLAHQIVMDGEGARKFIEITVKNAKSFKRAREICFSIANSILVKTAIAGEDANWGRLIMAIGKTEIKLEIKNIKIYMQNFLLCANGKGVEMVDESGLARSLKNRNVNIMVDLGEGDKEFTGWTSDLTEDYIKINADYRS